MDSTPAWRPSSSTWCWTPIVRLKSSTEWASAWTAMMPGKLRAPMATPSTLPSQNFRSRIATGASSPPDGGAHRRPHIYIIMACRSCASAAVAGGRPIIMPGMMGGRGGGNAYGRPSRSSRSILDRPLAALIRFSHSRSGGRDAIS